MKRQIKDYLNRIDTLLAINAPGTDWEAVLQTHLDKISFYMHERLIHLIVTVLFALMETIFVVTAVITESFRVSVVAIVVLVLLIPYILHYYFLENSVQKLYLLYDEIKSRLK